MKYEGSELVDPEAVDYYVMMAETANNKLAYLYDAGGYSEQWRWTVERESAKRFYTAQDASNALERWWTMRTLQVARTYGNEYNDTGGRKIYENARCAIGRGSETYWR